MEYLISWSGCMVVILHARLLTYIWSCSCYYTTLATGISFVLTALRSLLSAVCCLSMQGNMRKNKVDRDEGRDISEKIALGMLRGTGGKVSGEAMYDSRLFNQSSGMDAGFGAEDEYNTYSRPLFDRAEAGSIYRPRQGADDVYGDADQQMAKLSDTSRFRADKGFKGAEGRSDAGPRDAPVQFEKGGNKGSDDPFGIGDIVDHRRDSGGGGPSSSSRGRDWDSRGDRDSSDRKRSRRD